MSWESQGLEILLDCCLIVRMGGLGIIKSYGQELPVVQSPPWTNLTTIVQKISFVIVGVYVFCSTPIWALPYALNEGGWISFVILGVFFVTTFYTALLIPSCVDAGYNQTTYPAIGDRAHGAARRRTISFLIFVFSMGTCFDCVMMLKDLMTVVFQDDTTWATIVVILIMLIIVCSGDLDEYIPWLPGIGLILVIVVVACSVYVGRIDSAFTTTGTVP